MLNPHEISHLYASIEVEGTEVYYGTALYHGGVRRVQLWAGDVGDAH